MLVAGVDGRRGGWAVALAEVGEDGLLGHVRWLTVRGQSPAGVREVLAAADAAGAAAIGVDAPLGLPEDAWRPCDLLAKRRLGPAQARVFLTPPRAVLAAPSYPDARETARGLMHGKSISAQTFGLRGVVLALDGVLRADPALAGRVVEVHPELAFMAMSGRAPGDPLPPKRTPLGRAARERALDGWLATDVPLDAPDGDDHLDALAAAWSAHRWASGDAQVIGGELDACGLPMRIVV